MPPVHKRKRAEETPGGAGPSAGSGRKKVTVDSTTRGGKRKCKTFFDPECQQPIFQGRNLTEVIGPRYERRPSQIARRAGVRSISEVAGRAADDIELPDTWSESDDDMAMPLEAAAEDCGWLAGAISRAHLTPVWHAALLRFVSGPSPSL